MEFWSAILGAVVGGAIALMGNVFTSIHSYRCQINTEHRQDKKRIYLDICSILGELYHIPMLADLGEDQKLHGRLDAETIHQILDELSNYVTKHTGEILLFFPNDIYSDLVRIQADIYKTASLDLNRAEQTVVEDLEIYKKLLIKVGDLKKKIKNDLYPPK